MTPSQENNRAETAGGPPPLRRDAQGDLTGASLADVIQWFLDYDPRVALMRHTGVEEIFQWKQDESRREHEEIYIFNHAEDRLAIGILQALTEYTDERALHGWISQLLNALDEATKLNEEMAEAYKLDTGEGASALNESAKIPTGRGRTIYLNTCWLEALCTAEIRVLGWIYQELYGKPYQPEQ